MKDIKAIGDKLKKEVGGLDVEKSPEMNLGSLNGIFGKLGLKL